MQNSSVKALRYPSFIFSLIICAAIFLLYSVSLGHNFLFDEERYLIKPGLTGWAQINYHYGSSVEDAHKKLQYDLYYIKNRSLILDAGIMLKTIRIALQQSGR